MGSTLNRVWQIYQHCTEDYAFLHNLYLNFIDASPEIARHLANMEMDHQVIMLRGSPDLLLSNKHKDSDRKDLKKIAHFHRRKGLAIPPQLYDAWLESLLAMVRIYHKSFATDLEQAWRDALEPGINHMKTAY